MEDIIASIIESPAARAALGETARQCTAKAKGTGERCTRSAIKGGFVCVVHGGGIPAVKKTARERLLAMVDPAMAALQRVLASHGAPYEVCGRSDGDRDPNVIRAAQIVLDRCGFGPTAHLTVAPGVAPSSPCVEWMTSEQLAAMDETFADATRRMAAGEEKQNHSLELTSGRITRVERVIVGLDAARMLGDGSNDRNGR